MKTTRIILAQRNLTVGNIAANKISIIDDSLRAHKAKADLIIFPELALTSYPPEDLLLRANLHQQIQQALGEILPCSEKLDMLIAYPEQAGDALYNSCSYLRGGQIQAHYRKQNLPNYAVFDEKRYFTAGQSDCLLNIAGIRAAITICEDLWADAPARRAAAAGAELLININASPYRIGKSAERRRLLEKRVQETGMAIIYVNLIGAQDELVFDGDSMAIDSQGQLAFHAPQFQEGLYLLELAREDGNIALRSEHPAAEVLSAEASIYQALVLGVRDYVHKNGFKGALIALSGGIDSALTLALAVDALGAENVEVVLMPSAYTAAMSNEDAKSMAMRLGVAWQLIPIDRPFAAFKESLAAAFAGLPTDTSEENIQARCRGVIMMALSNKSGRLVLTTGNKSEMAVGYASLYGDMAGGFAPLKDVSKTLVYRLARWRNAQANMQGHVQGNEAIIPPRIIERPPSAELRPEQKDEDSLPPYAVLDPILERYIELDQSPAQIVAAGFEKDTVLEVVRLVDRNEYKRRQAAPGVRITRRAFGRDRRYPLTSAYKEF